MPHPFRVFPRKGWESNENPVCTIFENSSGVIAEGILLPAFNAVPSAEACGPASISWADLSFREQGSQNEGEIPRVFTDAPGRVRPPVSAIRQVNPELLAGGDEL